MSFERCSNNGPRIEEPSFIGATPQSPEDDLDDFEAGLTMIAKKLRRGGLKQNQGCADFVLRARDEIQRLTKSDEFHTEACAAHQGHIDELTKEIAAKEAEIQRLWKDHIAMQAIRDKGVYLVPIGFRSDRLWEKVWRGRTIAGYDTDGLAYTDPADCLIAAAAAEDPDHAH